MKYLREYIKRIWKIMLLFLVFAAVMAVIFALYDLPAEPAFYGAVLCLTAGTAFFLYGYAAYYRHREIQHRIADHLPLELENLEKLLLPSDGVEEGYQQMLMELNRLRMEAESGRQTFYTELTDYYTMWAHQIKTPISAMRLLLNEETPDTQAAASELFRIEQYVEMVLGYLRTEDMSSDMNFQSCSLDRIIREQIHKYARIFIGRKISLDYSDIEKTVLSDPKWLGFVIGQILSNALKYTKKGKISIYTETVKAQEILVIEDTGIGIRPEDLPRVFEKGFTGCNGREECHSTGIGLYLCAKIMKRLGHEIFMESVPGKGTKVFLFLERTSMELF
ncbi:MAG: sensor histidine kinase [Blautia sp.]|nr:sensor histidine kinase [Blautia sp.]